MTKNINTFLILKYGSLDRALTLWLTADAMMNKDEKAALREYSRTKFKRNPAILGNRLTDDD